MFHMYNQNVSDFMSRTHCFPPYTYYLHRFNIDVMS